MASPPMMRGGPPPPRAPPSFGGGRGRGRGGPPAFGGGSARSPPPPTPGGGRGAGRGRGVASTVASPSPPPPSPGGGRGAGRGRGVASAAGRGVPGGAIRGPAPSRRGGMGPPPPRTKSPTPPQRGGPAQGGPPASPPMNSRRAPSPGPSPARRSFALPQNSNNVPSSGGRGRGLSFAPPPVTSNPGALGRGAGAPAGGKSISLPPTPRNAGRGTASPTPPSFPRGAAGAASPPPPAQAGRGRGRGHRTSQSFSTAPGAGPGQHPPLALAPPAVPRTAGSQSMRASQRSSPPPLTNNMFSSPPPSPGPASNGAVPPPVPSDPNGVAPSPMGSPRSVGGGRGQILAQRPPASSGPGHKRLLSHPPPSPATLLATPPVRSASPSTGSVGSNGSHIGIPPSIPEGAVPPAASPALETVPTMPPGLPPKRDSVVAGMAGTPPPVPPLPTKPSPHTTPGGTLQRTGSSGSGGLLSPPGSLSKSPTGGSTSSDGQLFPGTEMSGRFRFAGDFPPVPAYVGGRRSYPAGNVGAVRPLLRHCTLPVAETSAAPLRPNEAAQVRSRPSTVSRTTSQTALNLRDYDAEILDLRVQMQESIDSMAFEKCAELRERIKSLESERRGGGICIQNSVAFDQNAFDKAFQILEEKLTPAIQNQQFEKCAEIRDWKHRLTHIKETFDVEPIEKKRKALNSQIRDCLVNIIQSTL